MSLRELRPGFDTRVLTPVLGVMFRDGFDGRVVSDGLKVRLSDPAQPLQSPRALAANGYGAFACHALRGLRPANPQTPPATRRYDLSVEDDLGRYLPLSVPTDLPHAGLLAPPYLPSSPTAATPHVPLFSAPARTVPAGVGAVRVELRLASDSEQPAAWARLELRLVADGRVLARGLADSRGCALLLCALPAPVDPPLGGAPAQVQPPLTEWPVSLHAFWSPAIAAARVPDLRALQSLPPVSLLQDLSATPPTPLAPARLVAGSPLVIRGRGSPYVHIA